MTNEIEKILITLQNEAPEVTRQMAGYAVVSSIVWILGSLIVISLCLYGLLRTYKESGGDAEVASQVIAAIFGIFAAICLFLNIDVFIHAAFFPKAYVASTLLHR